MTTNHIASHQVDLMGNLCQIYFNKTVYNLSHNILELYNVLIQTRLTTSKTERDN